MTTGTARSSSTRTATLVRSRSLRSRPESRDGEAAGWYFASPHGAMMLSGCFGLVRGIRSLDERGPALVGEASGKVPDKNE